MHDCMQHDPIQGLGNLTIFEGYLLPHL